MKKFLGGLALFALPLVAGAAYLFQAPYDKEFAYYSLRQACDDRGRWIHDRVFLDPRPVDVLFVGTSQTMYGVDDGRLERTLNRDRDEPMHLLNVGYCQMGRNLHYAIVKDALRSKQVRHVVLGVSGREFRRSHEAFGYVADAEDVLAQGPALRSTGSYGSGLLLSEAPPASADLD